MQWAAVAIVLFSVSCSTAKNVDTGGVEPGPISGVTAGDSGGEADGGSGSSDGGSPQDGGDDGGGESGVDADGSGGSDGAGAPLSKKLRRRP